MAWLDLSLDRESDYEQLLAAPERTPSPVVSRWMRAIFAGARAEGPADEPLLTAGRLANHRERVDQVLHLLDHVLEPVVDVFRARHFSVLFADTDGVIVDQRAGGHFADTARRARLQAGAVWDESTRGTNAIGTAIAEARPVAVHGAAHLARTNHGLVCYAAPVRDPWGDIIGVLDATSFVQQADPFAGAAVFSTARAIEEALRLSTLQRAGGSIVERLLGRLRDPALLVTPDGCVTFANQLAVDRGLPLGPTSRRLSDVHRTRAQVQHVLPVTTDELSAAATGQLLLQGIEVEPVHDSSGRCTAWLVVLPPMRSAPAPTQRDTSHAFDDLVGTDAAIVACKAHAARVAPSELPVLVLGETGTGKELVARGLHAASRRGEGPFVAVNCAALSPSLLHAELFGYVDGAFTGAARGGREGHIATAHGGTLFLDELGEMPRALQALLLRFLQDGSYYRVGDTELRQADVRIVAATCADLPALVTAGSFRDDLYYRLRGACIQLPPVRERRDLGLLCPALLTELSRDARRRDVPRISSEAQQLIEAAPWPGNVRQLRMALHHALVLAGTETTIQRWHLPELHSRATPTPQPAGTAEAPSLADAEAEALRRALDSNEGNVSAAARALGVARSTVYRLMRKYRLGQHRNNGE